MCNQFSDFNFGDNVVSPGGDNDRKENKERSREYFIRRNIEINIAFSCFTAVLAI